MPERDHDLKTKAAPAGSTRRSWLVPVIVGVLILAVAVAAFALLTADDETSAPAPAPQAPAGSDVVTEFDGDGDGETGMFEVEEGWEIRWETTGERLEIAVTGDEDIGTVLRFDDGPGGGTTRPIGSGSLRLEMTADGPWSVLIINHEPDEDSVG
jgi:hypothetical protein